MPRRAPWPWLLTALVGCASAPTDDGSAPSGDAAPGWTSSVALEAGAPLGGCAIGDADPSRPGNEVVAVAQDGAMHLVYRDGGAWSSERIATTPGEMIQVAVGDLLPERPGEEVLAVGVTAGTEDDGGPGAAVLVYRGDDGVWVTEQAFEDRALLHAVAIDGGAAYVGGYGQVAWRLVRGGDGWSSQRLGDLPGPGRSAAATPFGVAFACRDAPLLIYGPEVGVVVDRREAGRARLGAAGQHLVVADDEGRLTLFPTVHRQSGSDPVLIYRAGDKLRGAVLADLEPEAPGLEAATAGYDGQVVLLRQADGAWAPEVVATDTDRFHHLASGVLPGSAAPALAAANLSGRLTVVQRAR